METSLHSPESSAIKIIILVVLCLIAVTASIMKGRSSKAARLNAWLEKPRNADKLKNWLVVGFFFFVFGGITLYYEITH